LRSHGGGIVGREAPAFYRMVPNLAFAGAPRFHGGFAPDEYPAILQRGEGVFTAGQMKALGRMLNSGSPVEENHVHITMNISALDSRSVAQTIQQHAEQITGIVNQAYNKRGMRGPKG